MGSLRNIILLLMVIGQIIATLGSGCGIGRRTSETPTNYATKESAPSEHLPSNQKPSNQSPFSFIDFGNTTYPWYPSFLNPPNGRRELKLQDGVFDVRENLKAGVKNLHIEVENVTYADLTGDQKEEAIVTLGGVAIFNRFVGAIFVFAVERNGSKFLWQHEFGDRADGGLRRLALDGRTLIIEEYERSEGDGGLCCPSRFTRSSYELRNEQFTRVNSESFSNETDYAEFLGYPDGSK